MIRTQIQLTEKQLKALKEMSAQKDISMAELIRQVIDFYLKVCGTVNSEERQQRTIKASGRFHSGKTDLSEEHDTYLAEVYEK